MERKQKVIVLWLMTMGGFACHTITDLLPLFWGEDIAISSGSPTPQGILVMMATLSYLIPVCGILCIMACSSFRTLRMVNAVLASLIALFNLVHAGMELPADNLGQYVVMPLMIIVGLLLAWHSVKLVNDDGQQCAV